MSNLFSKINRESFRAAVLSFFITLLVLGFVCGCAAVLYNTSSVLYGAEAVSIKRGNNTVEMQWMDRTMTVGLKEAEQELSSLAGYAPLVPDELRGFLLAAGGVRCAAYWFWQQVADSFPEGVFAITIL